MMTLWFFVDHFTLNLFKTRKYVTVNFIYLSSMSSLFTITRGPPLRRQDKNLQGGMQKNGTVVLTTPTFLINCMGTPVGWGTGKPGAVTLYNECSFTQKVLILRTIPEVL